MATVRQLVHWLAGGQISQERVENALRARQTWPVEQEVTVRQTFGADDIPPPDDNSPDWIFLSPGLDTDTRGALYAAVQQSPGYRR